MTADIYPIRLLLLTVSGWVTRHQQDVIEYLVEENRVLKEQLRGWHDCMSPLLLPTGRAMTSSFFVTTLTKGLDLRACPADYMSMITKGSS